MVHIPTREGFVVRPDHILKQVLDVPSGRATALCSCGHWSQSFFPHIGAPDIPGAHAFHIHMNTPEEPALPIAEPFAPAIRAGALGAAQIGHTVRATTVDGVTIEDRLSRVEHARYGADKTPSVRVSFENVQPAGAVTVGAAILGQTLAFKINPDTIVAITAGPAL